MLYREIIAVCSQIHTKHLNTTCGQNVELLNVMYSNHWVFPEPSPRLNTRLFSCTPHQDHNTTVRKHPACLTDTAA